MDRWQLQPFPAKMVRGQVSQNVRVRYARQVAQRNIQGFAKSDSAPFNGRDAFGQSSKTGSLAAFDVDVQANEGGWACVLP